MERRSFLKLASLLPFYLRQTLQGDELPSLGFSPSDPRNFDHLEVEGTYEQIGFVIGKHFRKNILQIIQRRAEWYTRLQTTMNARKGRAFSKALLTISRKHFPHIVDEIKGMADGAGIDFQHMWAMSTKSELDSLRNEPPGCSSIFVSDEEKMWLFHNEDGHTAYGDLMFTVKVKPPSGVSFISLVYPGIITGNGPSMNDRGIVQSTNYIGSTRPEPGIPRYVIGRAILEAKTAKEAADIASMTPRAYPYHHHIGSCAESRYLSVETIPGAVSVQEPKRLSFHTNHLLYENTCDFMDEDEEYKNTSSLSRFEVIEKKLTGMNISDATPEALLSILSSHERAPYSPCRHPEGDIKGVTLATAFFDLKQASFRLYRGNPCRAVPGELSTEFKF